MQSVSININFNDQYYRIVLQNMIKEYVNNLYPAINFGLFEMNEHLYLTSFTINKI